MCCCLGNRIKTFKIICSYTAAITLREDVNSANLQPVKSVKSEFEKCDKPELAAYLLSRLYLNYKAPMDSAIATFLR